MVRPHVICAVFFRNLASYFSGLLGYVVIVAFVVIAAALAFDAEFFASNSATLDQLTKNFPALLVFLIPAITMTSWADERKLGTDELLFTMPATDFEILIGKYKAVFSVYTIALLFSCTNLVMLNIIGNPDPGVQVTTYIGYWLAGAALVSAGMLASSLTSNAAVAFVLGAVFCSVPVFISTVTDVIVSGLTAFLTSLGVSKETIVSYLPAAGVMDNLTVGHHLSDFALGILPLEGTVYFISLTVFFLYLNYVVISRRHWNTGETGNSMGLQYLLRGISLAVILVSVTTLSIGSVKRFDFTQKHLYTLSPTTLETLKEIDSKRPVRIQAYVSPSVPEEYAAVHRNLVGLLREMENRGGGNVNVRMISVEPYSEAAEEARHFGIEARKVQTERDGQITVTDVYLGARISSGNDEVIVPFFDVGMSVEYELTRSLRTVSKDSRLTVGILSTDARVMGGFDSATFRSLPEWQIVQELKKQYKLESVSPDTPIESGKYDVLIAILPSSLTQPQLDNFVAYVEGGNPTLIFADPMPVFGGGRGMQLAPRQPKPRQGGMMGRQAPPEQKGDNGQLTSLLNVLEVAWDNGEVVFDKDNPHPRFSEAVRPELVFISSKKAVREAFSTKSEITNGLQEMLLFFPGTVVPREKSGVDFTPLLRTGASNSGLLKWDDLVTSNPMFGMSLNPNPKRVSDEFAHVVAAQIKSSAKNEKNPNAPKVNAIFVADVDVVSDDIFSIAKAQSFDLKIDNITFVLNCVDSLAGEEAFIALRKRRDDARTLKRVEDLTAGSVKERSEAITKAQEEADKELKKSEEEFDKSLKKIEEDSSLDERTKIAQMRSLQQARERKLKAFAVEINRKAEDEIRQIKAESEREISAVKGQFRFWAIVLPPLPAIFLGLFIGLIRATRERKTIIDERLVK